MKKLYFLLLLSFAVQGVLAQETFKEDVKKYIALSGQFTVFDSITEQLEQSVEEGKREDFKKELAASFSVLVDRMAALYMEEFTHEDIKQLIAFYSSPIGLKLADKNVVLMEKGGAIGEEWVISLQGLMAQYVDYEF